jgi:glycosyltransferase involved in cell wall biosynthesis
MEPLVSVVIPTYNYVRFLPRANESVLGQTYPSVECIVVDDGSTDGTAEMAGPYGCRIRYIASTNRGPAAARNLGAAAASGPYLAFLDADDWWAPEKLARQVRWLEEHKDFAAVGCGAASVDRNLQRLGQLSYSDLAESKDDNLRHVAVRRKWIGGSCSGIVIQTSAYMELGGFDEALSGAEDWDLWMRLVAEYRISNLTETLVTIHRHGTGYARAAALAERQQWAVYRKATAQWTDVLNPTIRRRMRALILRDAACEYRAQGELKTALTRCVQSIQQIPLQPAVIKMALVLCRDLVRYCLNPRSTPPISSIESFSPLPGGSE